MSPIAEPDERCTRAVKALSRLPFYRARILSTWTSLLLQRCSAMQPLAPTGDAEEEEDGKLPLCSLDV